MNSEIDEVIVLRKPTNFVLLLIKLKKILIKVIYKNNLDIMYITLREHIVLTILKI